MNTSRRMILWLSLLGLLLMLACGWSYAQLAAAREGKLAVEADCREGQRLAGELRQMQSQPALASGAERQAEELARQIEAANQKAGIDPRNLISIRPEPAQRVGESVYKAKPTQVQLKNVTLQQLAGFLYALTGPGSQLAAPSLRVTAPREADTLETWTAEVTVSYLLYDPPRQDNRPGKE